MGRTIILYHKNCPDGFTGAYAAWKKFGDSAEYVGLHRGMEDFPDVSGVDVYFIDFILPQEEMDRVVERAASVTALDHHEGVREVTESMPTFVFDNNRSGATIAWDYFHPNAPRPALFSYIEDDDLFRFALPHTRGVLAYIGVHEFSFAFWDEIVATLEDPQRRDAFLSKCVAYEEYFTLLAEHAAKEAKLVEFEGYTCYFATAHPYKPMKSLIGNMLARKQPPFALVVSAHPRGYGVSIRGVGDIDVAEIASRYGGNGHKLSAGFLIPAEGPVPWKEV